MNVRFFAGTRAQYDRLPVPRDQLALYFCSDSQELFWGDRLLSDGIRVIPTVADLPSIEAAADGVVYYITQTRNGYTLAPNRKGWLQTIYAPATDAYKVPESELYNTVTTVGAVRDIEAKIYKTIDDKFDNLSVEIPELDELLEETLGNYVTEDELSKKQYLTKIPEEYVTKPEITTAIAEATTVKANAVPFITDKFVTNAFGSFTVGESVKGLTIEAMLTKLLGLADSPVAEPDEPDIPVEPDSIETLINKLITERSAIYSQNESGTLVRTSFAHVVWSKPDSMPRMDGISTFYQIADDDGTIIEAGYQEATKYNEEAWLTIALPSDIKQVKIKMYEPDINDWQYVNFAVTPVAEQTIPGYTIWTVPEEYEVQSGDTYRFVIIV